MRRLGWISLAAERGATTTLRVVRKGDQRDEDGEWNRRREM